VVKETNATTGNITDYLYGDDLIKQSRAANDSYYLYDGLGSTRALTDSAGTITDSYNYESFGSLLNQVGTTENNYLFTGEQYDNNLDNYYLRARYYDQSIGRFTQQDTWMGQNQDPITLHKYLYANTDPVNNIDPTGNFTMSSVMTAVNIVSTLASTAQAAVDIFQITSSGESVTATDVGFIILMSRLPIKKAQFFLRKACSKNSFIGDTLVSTENGLVEIKDIVIGDMVWSYNEDSNEKTLQEVTHLIQNEGDKSLVDIKLSSGEVITATADHPVYVFDKGQWRPASKLISSDELFGLNGQSIIVDSLRIYDKEVKVFNLTVSDNHTYYVGEDSILSHNADKCNIGEILVKQGKLKKLNDKYLKKEGIDAHDAKELITGSNKRNARFDMVVEKNSKKVFLKSKDGKLIESPYSINELKALAPLKR
jgi:RHS repeat-associated protein